MRYPKDWEADARITVSSYRKMGEREFQIALYVHRPGTPDHARRILARPSYSQLLELKKQLDHHLGLD